VLVSRCIWENIGSTLKKRSRENNWPRHDRARHAAVPLLLRGAVAMGVLKYVATSPTRRGHTSRYKTCCEKTSSECDNQRASWMQASNLSDWQSRCKAVCHSFIATRLRTARARLSSFHCHTCILLPANEDNVIFCSVQ